MAWRVEKLRVFDEDDVRSVLPESTDPTIQIWAPELKMKRSCWHVGTSSVTRVKINALSSDVEICTNDATTINGTASELWEEVETIGTAWIHVFGDIPMKVHVTRSKDVAPFVVDGIIGQDVMKTRHWELNQQDKTFTMQGLEIPMSVLPGNKFIDDYIPILIDRIRNAFIAEEKDCWAVASKKLNELRSYLPPDVGRDDRYPITDVLEDYADCFYLPGDKLRTTKLFKYPIISKGNGIINNPQKSRSQETWDKIEIFISDLLKQGIIKASTSLYNHSVGLKKEKPDSRGNIKYRIAVNFSALNDLSNDEDVPIPGVYDAIENLYGDKYFSVLKLASVSYHIEVEPQDRYKTAFTTRSGHYEFQRMPVDIKNASQYTQRLMNEVLKDMKGKVFVCKDEILIHTPTIEEHEVRLRRVLSLLRNAGLKLQPESCHLFRKSVTYLGHLITDEGLLPDPAMLENLRKFQVPSPRAYSIVPHHDFSTFRELFDVFKHFLPDYVMRAKPLWDFRLTNMSHWSTRLINCFVDLQSSLLECLPLRYPNWNRKFIIETSFSESGIEAVLKQKTSKISQAHPIVYAGRIYEPFETSYTDIEKDKLAYAWAKKEFRRYLQHKSLMKCAEKESIDK